jgi:hypothetical protein
MESPKELKIQQAFFAEAYGKVLVTHTCNGHEWFVKGRDYQGFHQGSATEWHGKTTQMSQADNCVIRQTDWNDITLHFVDGGHEGSHCYRKTRV